MNSGEEHPKIRDIYAYYGYSMSLAQQLEGLLNQAIFAFVIIPEKLPLINEMANENNLEQWEKLVESEDAKLLRKTMGNLMGTLRNKNILSEDIEKTLKMSLTHLRNFNCQFPNISIS